MNCGTPVNPAAAQQQPPMGAAPYYMQGQTWQAAEPEVQVPHQQPPVQQPWQPSTQQPIQTSAPQQPGGDIWVHQPAQPQQAAVDPDSIWRTQQPQAGPAPTSTKQNSPLDYLKRKKPASDAEPDEWEDVEAPNPSRNPLKKKGAKGAQPAKKKKKSFKEAANHDGYYNDQRPVDDDYADYENAGIKWLPMVLGVLGIALFAFAIIQIQLMF